MKSTTILPCVTLLGLLISTSTLPAAESGIIARVSGEDVTAATIAPFFSNLSERDRKALEENPALLSQTVRSVILRRLLMKEAISAGWDKRPEVVELMERAREASVIESYMAEITKVPDGYPSDKEVAEIYDSKKADLQVPKQYELAQIFVPQSENADKVQSAAAKAMLDQIQTRLKSGADFDAVARETSQEKQTAGGNIGWLALDAIQPEVRKAVESLGKGTVSAPIKLKDGFYIVKVLDTRDARIATLEEVKPRIVEALRTQRIRQNQEAYLAKLQQQYPMVLDELSLPKLLK